MAVVALTHAAGSPGTSTTALGLTLSWPGPTLLIEADPAGSTIASGWCRSSIAPKENLINVVTGGNQADDLAETIWAQVISLAPGGFDLHGQQRLYLPGLVDPAQAPAVQEWWRPIGQGLRNMSDAGWTVVIDAGRLTQSSYPLALLEEADQLLLVCRSTLSSIVRSAPMAGQLRHLLASLGREDRLGLVVIDQPSQLAYSQIEAAKTLKAKFRVTIPQDRDGAAVLSDGVPLPRRQRRRLGRSATDGAIGSNHDATASGDLAANPTLMAAYRSAATAIDSYIRRTYHHLSARPVLQDER